MTTSWKIWFDAARPRTLGAAAAPVVIGTALAYADSELHLPSALVALLCALLIQIGTNYGNDYFDGVKGTDTSDRLGPRRATSTGLVAPQTMLRATLIVFALAALGGLYLIARGGWAILLIGVLSIASGIGYTAGRHALGYLGLGDLFVFVFFGPVAVAGTYYVQALDTSAAAIVAGFGPGLLSVAILVVNNLRDVIGDRIAGKRTLAVRLGEQFARWEYVACVLGAALVALLVPLFGAPWPVIVAVGALWLAREPLIGVFVRTGRDLNPLLGATNRVLLVYSVLFALGCLL
jgi:1,4-dihydroxy-2-naphthoate octaprenyltransferase